MRAGAAMAVALSGAEAVWAAAQAVVPTAACAGSSWSCSRSSQGTSSRLTTSCGSRNSLDSSRRTAAGWRTRRAVAEKAAVATIVGWRRRWRREGACDDYLAKM